MGTVLPSDSPEPHVSRRRRGSSRRARRRRTIAVLAGGLLGAVLLAGFVAAIGAAHTVALFEAQTIPEAPAAPRLLRSHVPAPPPQLVYRHSVVPGGVHSALDAEAAMDRDPTVRAHYAGINPHALRVETLPEDRLVHMSYRVGDNIYWTKQPVRLRQGETILTDGVNQIRTRCGNCIAMAPLEPTADDEVDEMEFDALVDPSEDVVLAGVPFANQMTTLMSDTYPGMLPESGFAPSGFGGDFPGFVPFFAGSEPNDFNPPGSNPPGPGNPIFELPPGFPNTPPGAPGDPGGPGNPDDPSDPGDPGDPGDPDDPDDPGNPNNPLDPEDPVPVPEPSSLLLLGGGISALLARRRKAKR